MSASSVFRVAVLVLAGCAETPMPAASLQSAPPPVDEDEVWGMIPAEADLVLWADMAKLRESAWTRESVTRVSEGSIGDGGFDPVDVDRLLYAKVPALRDGASVLIAQGRFDRARVAKAFAEKGGPVERSSYRTAEVLTRGDESLALLGKHTVLSGMTVAVRAAIDCNIGVSRSIDTEPWIVRLRKDLPFRKDSHPVAALYVQLQPATREALLREMGEGGSLQEFAGVIELDRDLDLRAIGVLPTEQEARDLAARLADRIREVRNRPVVAAFGLGGVIDSLRFLPSGDKVRASLHLSQRDRAQISERMSIVADTLAKMRNETNTASGKEKP